MKKHLSPIHRGTGRQQGVVLLFALIALLVMMIGAVALVRSFSTSLQNTGSLAFKKDMTFRNEAAIARILALARQPNNLTSSAIAANPYVSMNYSPQILDYDRQGIPTILLANDSTFDATTYARTSNDIWLPDDQIRLRFVIDRQCDSAGDAATLGTDHCVTGTTKQEGGSADVPIRAENASSGGSGAITVVPVYRLSIRATGPKGALAFYQTTFTLR